jgi:hypothetical protein
MGIRVGGRGNDINYKCSVCRTMHKSLDNTAPPVNYVLLDAQEKIRKAHQKRRSFSIRAAQFNPPAKRVAPNSNLTLSPTDAAAPESEPNPSLDEPKPHNAAADGGQGVIGAQPLFCNEHEMAVEYWCTQCKQSGCVKCILATCAAHKYVELAKVSRKALVNAAIVLESGRSGSQLKEEALAERIAATRAAIEYCSDKARANMQRHLLDVRRQFALYEQRCTKSVEDHHADALDRLEECERRSYEELGKARAL